MSDAHACGKPAYREQPSAKGSRAPTSQPSPVAQQASESQRYAARATRAPSYGIAKGNKPIPSARGLSACFELSQVDSDSE